MDDAIDVRRKYADAVRNIPIADVVALEKGEPCTSPVMQYARSCYLELVKECSTSSTTNTLSKPAVCKWVESFGI